MAENDEGQAPQGTEGAGAQRTENAGDDLDALKTQLAEREEGYKKVKQTNVSLEAEKRNVETEAKKLKKELEKYRQAEAEAEKKALEGQGKYQEIIEQQANDFNTKFTVLEKRHHRAVVANRLQSDMAAVGYLPEAIPDAVRLLSGCFSISEDDAPVIIEDAIRQLIPNWQPITAAEGKPKTLRDVLLDFGQARAFYMQASIQPGAGPSSQAKSGMTLSGFQSMSEADQQRWATDNPALAEKLLDESMGI